MSNLRPAQNTALQIMANRKSSDGEDIIAHFDATYTDRDGTIYPAHVQHLDPTSAGRESEPLFRVWVDQAQNEVVFKVSHVEGRASEQYWRLFQTGDGMQRQEKISAGEAAELCAGCQEYKCMLFTPRITPHALAADSDDPYAKSVKIPIADLIVDFGDAVRGVKLNHVGNVRSARHATARTGELRLPYFTLICSKRAYA